MRSLLVAGLVLLAAGCGSRSSGDGRDTQAAARPLNVSLVGSAGRSPKVVGGTAAMRARAREILDGMERSAITEVRFGPPPKSYRQFRHVTDPGWITITVATQQAPFHGDLVAQLRAEGPLWQADVLERAYLARPPAGQPRIRGGSRFAVYPGGRHFLSSEPRSAFHYLGPPPTEATVRERLRTGAERARFTIRSISFMHPDRLAVTAILEAGSREGFGQRLGRFTDAIGRIGEAITGLQWEIVDRCGNPVAIWSAGFWTHPRWLCPNPWIIGVQPTEESCRKQADSLPVC